MTDTHHLDRLCGAFRRRLRVLLAVTGTCRLLILGLGLFTLALVLDWRLHLGTPWRFAVLVVVLGGVGLTGFFLLRAPLLSRWTNEAVLAYYDSLQPDDRAMLLEVYELALERDVRELDSPAGQALARRAAAHLDPLLRQATSGQPLNRRPLLRWGGAGLLVLLGFVAAAIPLSHYLSIGAERFFNPFSTRRWPHRTTITLVEPATGWTIPQLEAFTVRAKVTGLVPSHVMLNHRGPSARYWVKEKLALAPDGTVETTFPEVREPIRFYIEGGDYTTDVQRIDIIERPYLKRIAAHYDYPDYAGIPNRTIESGQLLGLEGTTVRLQFECSMPLRQALFILDGTEPEALPLVTETTFEKTLRLTADGGYSVQLFEKHGFREAKPERYEIRVTPDNPPEVELLLPGRDLVATGRASVAVALRASDDFGLKTVQFFSQINEAQPAALSDRITGPLEPRGSKVQEARFTWDLRKMDWLAGAGQAGPPPVGVLRYFVRVEDVNPTGRGTVETGRFQIKLVKPSDFHFETFERAKRLEAEARVAWESQYAAWELGPEWLKNGTGSEDDLIWTEMSDKQDLAQRAAQAMSVYLRDLIGEYEQNDMGSEFMARRLGGIAELLRQVTETEHPAVAEGLKAARPRTDADAAPERLKALRAAALARVADHQKLALLNLERLAKRLFDWRDLQTSLIRTSLLHDDQREVLDLTEALAPKTLGWEVEDLPDAVQDELLTLGKRQRTIFDVETELEKELEFQMYRAELEARLGIVAPLRAAYRGLRESRVNDNLKLATEKIEDNQAFQILENQRVALTVLDVVKGGLIHAGQETDPEPAITLAMVPSKIIRIQPKPPAPEEVEAAVAEVAPVPTLTPEELLANLPVGGDPVTTAINLAWEAEDQVLARTRYLAERAASPGEMPRYLKMKQGILAERQGTALRAVEAAAQEAQKTGRQPVAERLKAVKTAFDQSQALIAAMRLGPGTQRLQTDAMAALDDLRRLYLPVEQAVAESAEENKSRQGVDAFKRKYLLAETDLDNAVAISQAVNHAHLLQRDVVRFLTRLAESPPSDPLLTGMEGANRTAAAGEQRQVASLLAGTAQAFGQLSEGAVRERVRGTGVSALLERNGSSVPAEIQSAAKDQALAAALGETASLLAEALGNLKDLFEERVRPAAVLAATTQEAPPQITLAEWIRSRSPEVLRERLEKSAALPPAVRDIMLRALTRDFPPQYRELLASYYAAFVGEEGKE